MTAYFIGTAVADTILEGSLAGRVLEIQLGGGAIFASLAFKLIAPQERSVFVGELGNDDAGKQFQKLLSDRGVEFLPELIGPTSSQAIWTVGEHGKRHEKKDLVTPRKNTADILRQNIQFEPGDYLVLQSMTTTENLHQYRDLIAAALDADVMIIFSPNTRPFIDLTKNPTVEHIRDAIEKRNLYLPPFEEQAGDFSHLAVTSFADMAALYFDAPHTIEERLSNFPLPAIVTKTKEATRLYYGESKPVQRFDVEKVPDVKNTVGTGDHFLGSLVGCFANHHIRRANMTPEALGNAVINAQTATRDELIRRKGIEQRPAPGPHLTR